MKLSRRTLVFAALAATTPLAILAACGSDTFSADQDAQTVDPLNDGSFGDSQTTDASADVDAAPPPPVPTWCQVNAKDAYFCADFDEGDITKAYVQGSLKQVMTVQQDSGLPGDLVTLGDGGESGPSSLLTYTPEPSTSGGTGQLACVRAALDDAPTALTFHLDFDLRIEVLGDLNDLGSVLFLDDLNAPGTSEFYNVTMATNTIWFVGTTQLVPLSAHPLVGVWTHFRYVVFPGGGTEVSQGLGPLIDGGPSRVLTTTTKPTLQIGQESIALLPTGGAQISYDNVVLRVVFPDGG